MAPVKRHALLLASIFVLHLFSEHEVVASRKSQEVGLFHHNFIRHSFHFLNVTEIDTFFVHQLIDCAFSCLRTVSCVSFNMAAYADANSTFLCELLASDKYNSSIEFLPHPHLHHHSIDTPCSKTPCENGGHCIPLYHLHDFKCICPPSFSGERCKHVVGCLQSAATRGSHARASNGLISTASSPLIVTASSRSIATASSPLFATASSLLTPTSTAAPSLPTASGCSDLYQSGVTASGVYSIDPDGQGTFPVYCDMITDGGGWTVFQRRQDGSQDFYLGWSEYKAGFGDQTGEFWLGLDKIHRLTASRASELRVELGDWEGHRAFAKYDVFSVGDEQSLYMLSVGSYSGTAGDSLVYHNEMKFSTKERDHDNKDNRNCAERSGGAWWYRRCHQSNLNGRYLGNVVDNAGACWQEYRSLLSLKSAEMKLRPKN